MKEQIKKHLKAIFSSYSEVIFMNSFYAGVVLFLITVINPDVGIAGFIAVISAYIFAKFLNMGEEFLSSGFYTYNPLLVGLSIGYLFKINFLTVLFTSMSGIFTLLFSIMLNNIFFTYLRLPVLSLPFVFVSSIIYLAVSSYSNLFVNFMYARKFLLPIENSFPIFWEGFFKSLGAILFSPTVLSGIVISILVFLYSRILFFLAVIGYATGSIFNGLLTGNIESSFLDINHFNFILIAMALGGIFLVPSIKSYIIALIGVLISIPLLSATEIFWSFYGVPAFTLPFNFITSTFIYVLSILSFPLVARFIRKTPEETLDFYLTNINRFKGTERGIHLPFSGKWTVYQGFNGKWTHKGSWKYAYDFVITDDEGKSYKGEGKNLNDYYAFRKPVLSPVRGRVVKVINDLPDNPIGEVDKINNWGNLVVIHDERGFYVEISHFSQYSIKVKEGDWVEVGTFLGLCGNSGYSPQPHIHVQVQLTPEIGGYTVPFSFISYISDNKFFSNNIPSEGEKVEPVFPDKKMDNIFSFILDDEIEYEVFEKEKKIRTLRLKVKMDIDGTFYFSTENGKLYFGKDKGTFYFYRYEGNDQYLKLFFMSVPKIPLINRKNIQWEDFIPISRAVKSPLKKAIILFLASFFHPLAKVKYTGSFINTDTIKGKIEGINLNLKKEAVVKLSQEKGIKSISFKDLKIIKKES